MPKPALGRGLGALLGGQQPVDRPATRRASQTASKAQSAPKESRPRESASAADKEERIRTVPLGLIQASALQPRKDFSPQSLKELADSIRQRGLLQPLLVRAVGDKLELIAGERRWRAAQSLGLKEIPVIVHQAEDAEVIQMMLIENIQRDALNPIEEAQAYAELIGRFQWRQEDLAAKVSKPRVSVSQALRLLKLPTQVQELVKTSRLSVGHAKVLLSLTKAKLQCTAAERVLKEQLTVRQTEDLVSEMQANRPKASTAKKPAPTSRATNDVHLADLRRKLENRLGTKVDFRYRQGRGSLGIKFFSDEELDRILQILQIGLD